MKMDTHYTLAEVAEFLQISRIRVRVVAKKLGLGHPHKGTLHLDDYDVYRIRKRKKGEFAPGTRMDDMSDVMTRDEFYAAEGKNDRNYR